MSLSSMWSPGTSPEGCSLLDDKMSTMRCIDGQRQVIHMIWKKNNSNKTNKIRKEVKKICQDEMEQGQLVKDQEVEAEEAGVLEAVLA